MPAAIPPAIQQKIVELRKQGRQFKEIAEVLGVSLNSARRYGAKADKEVVLAASPASRLTEQEVNTAKFVLAQIDLMPCPHCRLTMIVSTWSTEGTCVHCSRTWFRGRPR